MTKISANTTSGTVRQTSSRRRTPKTRARERTRLAEAEKHSAKAASPPISVPR